MTCSANANNLYVNFFSNSMPGQNVIQLLQQNDNAGIETVKTAGDDVIMEASFAGTDNGFTVMLDGDEKTNINIWNSTAEGMNADGYGKFDTYEMTAFYLVSPEFTLDGTRNIVSYDQTGEYFSGEMYKLGQFVIREVGGEWNVIDMNYPTAELTSMTNTGEVDIPSQFNGKKVQVAFKYVCNGGAASAIWTVANLLIKRGAEKADPCIAFSETEVEYELNEEHSQFVAPELINPNHVVVKYTSSNPEVATVEELTGEVTVQGGGVTTITVTSEETSEFKSATASYTLNVKAIPTAIKNVDLENGNEKVFNLQGMRVKKSDKGIYIVNGKKIVIK